MRIFACIAALAAAPLLCAASGDYFVYAGTYTGQNSKGIYAWRFSPDSGRIAEIGLAAETQNPSFLALHPSGRYLYAANEIRNGTVTAFAVEPATGKLTALNSVDARGAAPCHLTVDKSGRYLLVANYSSGTIAAFAIGADGKLGASTAFHQHKGSGPNRQRQSEPHAHSINLSPNQRFAVAADLGTDDLFVYAFDQASGALKPHNPPSAKTAPGAGPRHFAFHPKSKLAFSINELNSTITAFSWDGNTGTLTPIDSVSTLPTGFTQENSTAEVVVHPNGRFVYGSNRGHDSIAVFAVDGRGKLKPVEHVPTQGRTPRNFAIDPTGRYLFAANQNSDAIVVFRLDPATGRLTPAGQTLSAGSPVCVRFLKAGK